MGQVESTLRVVNGRLVGNRNWRLSCHEGWDFRHITMRRQLVEQEAREVTAIVNQDGITTELSLSPEETNDDDLSDLDVDFWPEDYDVDPNPEPQQQNPDAEPEDDDQHDDSGEDFADASPGDVIFDTDRTAPISTPPRR